MAKQIIILVERSDRFEFDGEVGEVFDISVKNGDTGISERLGYFFDEESVKMAIRALMAAVTDLQGVRVHVLSTGLEGRRFPGDAAREFLRDYSGVSIRREILFNPNELN